VQKASALSKCRSEAHTQHNTTAFLSERFASSAENSYSSCIFASLSCHNLIPPRPTQQHISAAGDLLPLLANGGA